MMNAEQEEKILKRLKIVTLLLMFPLNQFLNRYMERDDAELYIAILMLLPMALLAATMLFLTYRKYTRDKAAAGDLKKYKTMMYFIGIPAP